MTMKKEDVVMIIPAFSGNFKPQGAIDDFVLGLGRLGLIRRSVLQLFKKHVKEFNAF